MDFRRSFALPHSGEREREREREVWSGDIKSHMKKIPQ
jgi:hypothetical protein